MVTLTARKHLQHSIRDTVTTGSQQGNVECITLWCKMCKGGFSENHAKRYTQNSGLDLPVSIYRAVSRRFEI